MKSKFLFLWILVFSFLLISPPIFASTSDGTIDSTYKYAWGENVGFIDFGSTAGAVHVTDTALSGSAYGENIGWINLSTVTNNNEGILGSYAWGENVGFIDFSKVTIGTDGVFAGGAYGENIGWITFGTTDNKVLTDWRPASSRTTTRHSSSGSSIRPVTPTIPPITTPQVTPITPCLKGELFNITNGLLCTVVQITTTPNSIDGQFPNLSDGQATPNITRILKLTIPRMTGEDIKSLQTYLNSHSYPCGLADGVFGTKTNQAVINFQKDNNLKPDGKVGPMTRAKMSQP